MRRVALLVVMAGCIPYDEADPIDDDPPLQPICMQNEATHTIAVGMHPTGIASDWFINGRPETIVVANSGSNTISLVRPATGEVPPYVVEELPTGAAPVGVRLLDLDHVWLDGHPTTDIVVTNSGDDTVTIYRNRGWPKTSDTMSAQATFDPPQTVAVGDHPLAIAPVYEGPVDALGHSEVHLAVANRDDNTVTILRNDAGSFTVWGILPVGNSPIALDSFDVNGDHYADLIVLNAGDQTLGVLLGGNALGVFFPMTTYAVGSIPVSLYTMTDEILVANAGSADITKFKRSLGGGLVSATIDVVGTPSATMGSYVADYDAGLARPVGGIGRERGIGTHPTSLTSTSGDLVASNTDNSTITISQMYCAYQ